VNHMRNYLITIVAVCLSSSFALAGCSVSTDEADVSMTDSSVTQTVESVTESSILLSERVTGSLWSGSIDGYYSDVESICFDIEFSQNDNSETTDEYRYDVTRNGVVVFNSDYVYVKDDTAECIYSADDSELIAPGSYEVSCYDINDSIVATGSTEVSVTVDAPELDKNISMPSDDDYLSSKTLDLSDSFEQTVDADNCGWWDYDDTSVGKSAYASDTSVIGLSIVPAGDDCDVLYYAYYYSEDTRFSGDERKPVYSGTAAINEYDTFDSFDIDYKPDDMKPGCYYCLVSTDPGFNEIAASASCLVVEETTGEARG